MSRFVRFQANTALADIEHLDKYAPLSNIVRIFAADRGLDGTRYYNEIIQTFRRMRDRRGVDLEKDVGVLETHRPDKKYASWSGHVARVIRWLKDYEDGKPEPDFEVKSIGYNWDRDRMLQVTNGYFPLVDVINLLAPSPHPLNYVNLRRAIRRLADSGEDPRERMGAFYHPGTGYVVNMAIFRDWFLAHDPSSY